jgi:hypothetical protein
MPRLRLASAAAVVGVAPLGAATPAHADEVAYLVNVMVRPGYDFAGAEAALAYGRGVCDEVAQGRTYADVMGEVKAHFATADEYQALYLISQAVTELCPALIWPLRNSAAHYRVGGLRAGVGATQLRALEMRRRRHRTTDSAS